MDEFAECKLSETNYPSVSKLREFVPKKCPNKKFMQSNFIPQFASLVVLAKTERCQFPAVVCVGPDWHDGSQCQFSEKRAYDNKLGIMFANRNVSDTGKVTVVWLHQFTFVQKLREDAFKFMSEVVGAAKEGSSVSVVTPVPLRAIFSAFVYEAGAENFNELCYYQNDVSEFDFKTLALVGPGLRWKNGVEILGILLCQINADECYVFWYLTGVRRCFMRELTYVDIV